MDWIKRNLLFVIGAVLSVGLLAFAGYYNYTRWQHKVVEGRKLDNQYTNLRRLNSQDPHPGNEQTNNIVLARKQEKEIREVLAAAARNFQAPAAIPALGGGPTNNYGHYQQPVYGGAARTWSAMTP